MIYPDNPTSVFPFEISFPAKISVNDFYKWRTAHQESIEKTLLQSGAVLFRGIDIAGTEDFKQLTDLVNNKPFDYVNGNSPRTKLNERVYTSTEYDASQRITMHNELSYTARWPSHLFFCCIMPADKGGETPLADSRQILREMDPGLTDMIRKKKIKYIRNLHGGSGFGPSWQDTFETTDRRTLEAHCEAQYISYEWKKDGGIKLVQLREGIISHPVTKEEVWFNQIDQFHPSHLSEEIYESLFTIFEDEQEFPTYVTYGDDSVIDKSVIAEIRQSIDKVTVINPWKSGDLLQVDNVLVSHGRMPYYGNRKILVSMC